MGLKFPQMTPEKITALEKQKNPGIDQIVERYLTSEEFILQHARTDNSQAAYRHDLSCFVQFCQNHNISSIAQLQPEDIELWADEMEPRYKPATISRRIASLRGLSCWATGEGFLAADFGERLPKVRVPGRMKLSQILSPEQQKDLIKVSKNSLRDAVIIQILLATGAMVQELGWLNVEDIFQSQNGQVAAIRLKNKNKDKARIVVIDGEACQMVKNYLAEQKLKTGQPLLRLTRQGVWEVLKEYGRKIKVPNLNPRILRKTFIANFRGSAEELSDVLGMSLSNATKVKRLI